MPYTMSTEGSSTVVVSTTMRPSTPAPPHSAQTSVAITVIVAAVVAFALLFILYKKFYRRERRGNYVELNRINDAESAV